MEKLKEKLHLHHSDGASASNAAPAEPPPAYTAQPSDRGPAHQQYTGPPQPYAGPPQQQYVPPPPPHHHYQQVGQNAGMMAGVLDGGSGGMWQDMAVGGMVGQRIDQSKSRAYWREQQERYYAGLPVAGMGDPRVAGEPPLDGRAGRRAARRRERWDRRAARRGIAVPAPAAWGPPAQPMAPPSGHYGQGLQPPGGVPGAGRRSRSVSSVSSSDSEYGKGKQKH